MTDKERELAAGEEIKAVLGKWGCTLIVGKPQIEAQGDVYIVRAAQVVTVQAQAEWLTAGRHSDE